MAKAIFDQLKRTKNASPHRVGLCSSAAEHNKVLVNTPALSAGGEPSKQTMPFFRTEVEEPPRTENKELNNATEHCACARDTRPPECCGRPQKPVTSLHHATLSRRASCAPLHQKTPPETFFRLETALVKARHDSASDVSSAIAEGSMAQEYRLPLQWPFYVRRILRNRGE